MPQDKSVRVNIDDYSPSARNEMKQFRFQVDRAGSIMTLWGNDEGHAIKRFREMNPDVVFILLK